MAASTKTGYDPSTMQWVDIEVAETREDPIPAVRGSDKIAHKKRTLPYRNDMTRALIRCPVAVSMQQTYARVPYEKRGGVHDREEGAVGQQYPTAWG
ncbi:hypothetical protein MRX96_057125 [Rhipicephalus microplus]